MDADVRAPRSAAALAALFGALGLACAGFAALGAWQVERLAWKQALVARVERQVHAAPTEAPGAAAWPGLQREADEYRRVSVRGEFVHAKETLVAATTALGSGYWVMTPLRSEQGHWVLVNRGFVPPEWRDRARRGADEPVGVQTVTGLLRLSEPGGRLWQHNDPVAGRWYSRDVAAMAAARELGPAAAGTPVAPYFIDAAADAGAAPGAWPRPGLTVLHFSNNHRVYAATWWALAAMAACAIGYLVIDERRLRRLQSLHRLAGESPVIRSIDRPLANRRH
jgi:surfeit locus 1 family protein